MIEQLIIEIKLKTDELTNSISKNADLRKKLILDNEEISKRYSELSEKSLTLEKEIEKNELRISNLKEQFSNLINRLCEGHTRAHLPHLIQVPVLILNFPSMILSFCLC